MAVGYLTSVDRLLIDDGEVLLVGDGPLTILLGADRVGSFGNEVRYSARGRLLDDVQDRLAEG